MQYRLPVFAIGCACLIALLAFGPRSAMGFFQLPILQDTGWDRTTFGMAMALQNLFWGLGQPFFGLIADKYGTWRVLFCGTLLYMLGLVVMAFASAPVWLHIGGGILIGLGVAACSFGVILAAIARLVPPEKRSFAFGMGTAAGSAGMFVFAPISQGLINALGWSDSLLVICAIMLLIPLLAIPLRGNAASSANAGLQLEQSVVQALREALATRGYLLLTSGFFQTNSIVVNLYRAFHCHYHFPADACQPYQPRRLLYSYGYSMVVDSGSNQCVGGYHVWHPLSRLARRHSLLFTPDRLFSRRLDGRISLRHQWYLRCGLVDRCRAGIIRRYHTLANPRRSGGAGGNC